MRCVLVISAVIYESAAVGAESESEPRAAWSSSKQQEVFKGSSNEHQAARAFNLGRARGERQHTQHNISRTFRH